MTGDVLSRILNAEPPTPSEPLDYEAFKVAEQPVSLTLHTLNDGAWPIGWSFIYVTPYDDRDFTSIVIAANVLTARIYGRKLEPVACVLQQRTCEWIQVYDETRHRLATPYSGPLVTRIDILSGPGKEPAEEDAS